MGCANSVTQADHMVAVGGHVSELVPCTYKLNDNQESTRNWSIRNYNLTFCPRNMRVKS